MPVTVENVMRSINNFFERIRYIGEFTIENGQIALPRPTKAGDMVAISGSAYNDGVHTLPFAGENETFDGVVWVLRPPAAFFALCDEIANYDEKNAIGAYASESFGEYSYTRANGGKTWEQAFHNRLAPYRRMFTEVDV